MSYHITKIYFLGRLYVQDLCIGGEGGHGGLKQLVRSLLQLRAHTEERQVHLGPGRRAGSTQHLCFGRKAV